MAKSKKKRSKAYSGPGASVARPSVTRISAANRRPLQQWWFEKKRFAKPALIATGVVIILVWLFIELIRILGGGNA